jgi:hypothetical protein
VALLLWMTCNYPHGREKRIPQLIVSRTVQQTGNHEHPPSTSSHSM